MSEPDYKRCGILQQSINMRKELLKSKEFELFEPQYDPNYIKGEDLMSFEKSYIEKRKQIQIEYVKAIINLLESELALELEKGQNNG